METVSTPPKLRGRDRLFWTGLHQTWDKWQPALVLVKPETVVKWPREGFRLYWQWISKRTSPGRPLVNRAIRDLIRQMVHANPWWGAPRIHGELLKLGMELSERTVSRLLPRPRKPPSQSWRTLLDHPIKDWVSLDFFTVPTATFRVWFVLVVLSHQRRRVLHFNITPHPTALWTAPQMSEALPEDTVPRYWLRDRDHGESFRQRTQAMNLTEVLTAPQSPWQSPLVEWLIGSPRRECLDHLIVLGERHLRRILKSYFEYYNSASYCLTSLCLC